MDGMEILSRTERVIKDVEIDDEPFVDIYPCSCGHCTECGLNVVVTPEELHQWAEEERENADRFEIIDGEWHKNW